MFNRYNKIFLFFAMAVFFCSCYKLDRAPFDKPSSTTFWQTDAQAKMGIMGVYAKMKQDNVFGIHFGTDCMSDIGLGYDPPGHYVFATGVYTPREGYVINKWQNTYDAIMRANDAIRNVSQSKTISDNVKKLVIGEAKFLRALFYFHLLDYFGGVPLYDETVDLDKDYNTLLKPRATVEETRTFIINDLQEAINTLPVSWATAEYGRATKGAAVALRGKVYLYAKEYTKAATDFEDIVNNAATYGYSLNANYADLFTPKGHKSGEMIFAIQNMSGVGTEFGMPMDFYMGTRSSYGSCWNNVMPSITLADMYELKDGKPFNWNDFIPGFNESNTVKTETFIATLSTDAKTIAKLPKNYDALVAMYAQRDPRMAQTLILPYSTYLGWVANAPKLCTFAVATGVNETNGFIRNNKGWYTYFWRKFVPEGGMDGLISNRAHTPINFPIIRFADVLLMLAECYNEAGKTTEAVALINRVRQRPSTNMPALNSGPAWLNATSKAEVFNRIVQERAVEFAAEGLRFSDIRRWKLAETLLSGKVEKQLNGIVALNRVFGSRDYLWPIPATEIEINSTITQNPGW